VGKPHTSNLSISTATGTFKLCRIKDADVLYMHEYWTPHPPGLSQQHAVHQYGSKDFLTGIDVV
jgi:hypothetical protein